jgi:hypothetical protein
MQFDCPFCRRPLGPADENPAFCKHCGRALRGTPEQSTVDLPSGERPTLAPPAGGPRGDGPPPAAVGGYRLVRPLGQGGMGTVYEAEEPATGRRVAVKLIRPDYAASPDALERFRREGRLASAIAHPRCVFVHAADEEAGRPYLVLELMPGRTLEHVVRENGPLPPDEAVSFILDVIDGLEAAHRVGVVHRDVKPSNCFLGADGHVKLGDFGLSKSLLGDTGLTRTGSFLGTPLYASPEQVRGDPVDARSDLYAAAATLYFLLTGRAPYESGDPVATLARAVTEPPPPPREFRPGLSPRLERVILKGLERDRRRRWRDLEEFRRALLPFVPSNLTPAPPGRRLAAYLLDWLVLLPVFFLLDEDVVSWFSRREVPAVAFQLARDVAWPLYFLFLEGVWGCSVGKRALRLRVVGGAGTDPPGWGRVLLRTAVFFGAGLAAEAYGYAPAMRADEPDPSAALGYFGLHALGLAAVLLTMRRRNGYRGLHEFLSGTRTVALPAPEEPTQFPPPPPAPRAAAAAEPARVGPFAVRGPAAGGPLPRVLRGEDSSLGREVVVWLRPADDPPLGSRAETTRPTRLRWLAGGRQNGARWDAFLAPAGQSLAALAAAGRRLGWAEARQLLKQLAVELDAAGREGSLPDRLSAEQVWLQPEGQVKLLEVPLDGGAAAAGAAAARDPLDLLAQAAVLALEGRPRPPGARGPVRAPVPPHASRLLARLTGPGPRYRDVGEFLADLEATRELPRRVSRGRRAATLVSWAAVNGPGLAFMLLLSGLVPAFLYLALLAMRGQVVDQRRELSTAADFELALAAVQPSLPDRLRGAAQWRADQDLLARREAMTARHRREERASLQRLPVVNRWFAQFIVRGMDEVEQDAAQRGSATGLLTNLGSWRTTHRVRVAASSGADFSQGGRVYAGLLLAWPAAAVVAAFVGRGGLGLRLHGLTLVRRDGRRAGRFRCAWRALVMWAPFTALLAGSVLIYTHAWRDPAPPGWGVTVSTLCWWAALAVLPLWAWLALRSPGRTWHDRLAGTYLVPR